MNEGTPGTGSSATSRLEISGKISWFHALLPDESYVQRAISDGIETDDFEPAAGPHN